MHISIYLYIHIFIYIYIYLWIYSYIDIWDKLIKIRNIWVTFELLYIGTWSFKHFHIAICFVCLLFWNNLTMYSPVGLPRIRYVVQGGCKLLPLCFSLLPLQGCSIKPWLLAALIIPLLIIILDNEVQISLLLYRIHMLVSKPLVKF